MFQILQGRVATPVRRGG